MALLYEAARTPETTACDFARRDAKSPSVDLVEHSPTLGASGGALFDETLASELPA